VPHRIDHHARSDVSVGEQLEDPAPHGITEHVERLHGANYFSRRLYKSSWIVEPSAADAWQSPGCRPTDPPCPTVTVLVR
jgi:hypothetical protein